MEGSVEARGLESTGCPGPPAAGRKGGRPGTRLAALLGETLMHSPEAIFLGLNGLAYDGTAMFDSTSQQETKFAFPEDPITGNGWLDVRHDGRALHSLEPIDLDPGETRSMTVAFIISRGPSLEAGLNGLKETYDRITENRSLWDY
jgi:hypothetical protein